MKGLVQTTDVLTVQSLGLLSKKIEQKSIPSTKNVLTACTFSTKFKSTFLSKNAWTNTTHLQNRLKLSYSDKNVSLNTVFLKYSPKISTCLFQIRQFTILPYNHIVKFTLQLLNMINLKEIANQIYQGFLLQKKTIPTTRHHIKRILFFYCLFHSMKR